MLQNQLAAILLIPILSCMPNKINLHNCTIKIKDHDFGLLQRWKDSLFNTSYFQRDRYDKPAVVSAWRSKIDRYTQVTRWRSTSHRTTWLVWALTDASSSDLLGNWSASSNPFTLCSPAFLGTGNWPEVYLFLPWHPWAACIQPSRACNDCIDRYHQCRKESFSILVDYPPSRGLELILIV